eukprot:3831460-Pleurochrysis_carterae.AAC.1
MTATGSNSNNSRTSSSKSSSPSSKPSRNTGTHQHDLKIPYEMCMRFATQMLGDIEKFIVDLKKKKKNDPQHYAQYTVPGTLRERIDFIEKDIFVLFYAFVNRLANTLGVPNDKLLWDQQFFRLWLIAKPCMLKLVEN